MPRKPFIPCSNCGALGWGKKNPEQTTPYTCRPCRSLGFGERKPYVRTKPYKHGYRTGQKTPCLDCGGPSWGERCRPCRDKAQAMYPGDVRRRRRELNRRRAAREQQSPGLTQWERKKLRARWVKQGRACTYCGEPATQIDHVVPLALGGTNQEGNLAPACRSCNQAKCDNLVIEWRAGKKARHMRWTPAPDERRIPTGHPDRRGKHWKVYFPTCSECEQVFTARRKTTRCCSRRCSDKQYNATHRPSIAKSSSLRGCADCGATVVAPRMKCDECVHATRRAAKRRYRQTPSGLEERRRYQRRRRATRGRGRDASVDAA